MEPEDGVAVAQTMLRKRSRVVEANLDDSPQPKKRKKAGRLAELPNMPLDILFEIFGHLAPYDLLKSARTNKAFRRLLLNRSSIAMWKTALNRVPELPPCPPEMSEPAWTNLVFSPQCHFCLTYTRNVFWFLRIRSCGRCSPLNLEDINRLLSRHDDWIPKREDHRRTFVNLVPTEPGSHLRTKSCVVLQESLCHPKSILDLRDKYLAVPEDDRGAFLEEQRRIWKEKCDHRTLCESWAKRQGENRESELRQLRADRAAAVVTKLEELGWGDDIRALPPGVLAKRKLVDRPQRLTERVWHNIKDEVIEFMEDMRSLRLKKELEQLVRKRKRPAVEFLKAFKKSTLHEGQLMPEGPDFCNFEPVKQILCQPIAVDVDVSSFDVVLPQLPTALARWRDELRGSLLSLLPNKKKKQSPMERSRRLELATTVFRCNGCGGVHGDPHMAGLVFTSPLLFYPQVLGHQCLTRKYDSEAELDYSINLCPDMGGPLLRKRWSVDSLAMESTSRKIAKGFIALAGLDPSIATAKDIDQLDLRFACRICGDHMMNQWHFGQCLKPIVSLWTWRAVIQHHRDYHRGTSLEISEGYEVIRELPEEVKSKELTNQEADLALWSCLRCSDTPSEMRESWLLTKAHLAELHDIESPTINEDYFKVFAADDIEATRPAFWVCWEEGSISLLPEELASSIAAG